VATLPLLCVVTPANVRDAVLAIPLLVAGVLMYGLQVWIVYADAAYFEYQIRGFIVQVLGASAAIDYICGVVADASWPRCSSSGNGPAW